MKTTTFAEKLRELREAAGLTQQQLAERSGLSLGGVRDYEQGRKEPSLRSAFKLADVLSVDCSVFRNCFVEPDAPRRKNETTAQRRGRKKA